MHRIATMPVTRFAEQSATVAVVGLGKIGLPLAIQYIRCGRRVIGCDANPKIVAAIKAGRSQIHEEFDLPDAVADAVGQGLLDATLDTTAAVRAAEIIVVIVPVVINDHREVDYRSLDAATEAIGAGLAAGKLVVYETTLPVGTTAHRLRPHLERTSGLRAGRDFGLAYSPERVSSGRVFHDLATYPKIVGGIDEVSTAAAAGFYRSVLNAEIISMGSPSEAEFVKLIETTYRDVNIALANEFARYADRHGLDVAAAIAAANTQPYSHVHAPGVGVGGHCIPVYPHFLLQDAGEELTLVRQARRINDGMAEYAVERIAAVIGSLQGATVLILGVAYRGDIRAHDFSSAKRLQAALLQRGAAVYIQDPLYTAPELMAQGYVPFRAEQAKDVKVIIVQSAHREYRDLDCGPFVNCQVVFDGRRALSPETVEVLGTRYLAIGDGHAMGLGPTAGGQ